MDSIKVFIGRDNKLYISKDNHCIVTGDRILFEKVECAPNNKGEINTYMVVSHRSCIFVNSEEAAYILNQFILFNKE